jgi:hypothetical protein
METRKNEREVLKNLRTTLILRRGIAAAVGVDDFSSALVCDGRVVTNLNNGKAAKHNGKKELMRTRLILRSVPLRWQLQLQLRCGCSWGGWLRNGRVAVIKKTTDIRTKRVKYRTG